MSNTIQLNRREFIKYQLRLQGSSMAEISRELGISASTVSQVCSGERTSQRVITAIAKKLNTSVEMLMDWHKGE
ncbi:helix-turn-helix transcriptional regulator [Thiomicrorhabdus sp. Milos-T2]|uniref:helix-turn-helix domain-containing protein n=1 Tax=Thiomicrorhabdus sp. Milos-T2 TaxID=90814 RepID=UPI00056F633D